jgi:hypothetical protein
MAERGRIARQRRPSTHAWVPGCQWDLIVTVDDATSEVSSAFFVEEEETRSSFQGLRVVMETKGLVRSLYTDRGSHYWHTDEAGGTVDNNRLTQVHRALPPLGITLIPAPSPEARGRAVFHGPRCLARDQTNVQPIEADSTSPRRRGSSQASGGRPIIDPGATGCTTISVPR